jgi:hypothetical protein
MESGGGFLFSTTRHVVCTSLLCHGCVVLTVFQKECHTAAKQCHTAPCLQGLLRQVFVVLQARLSDQVVSHSSLSVRVVSLMVGFCVGVHSLCSCAVR